MFSISCKIRGESSSNQSLGKNIEKKTSLSVFHSKNVGFLKPKKNWLLRRHVSEKLSKTWWDPVKGDGVATKLMESSDVNKLP